MTRGSRIFVLVSLLAAAACGSPTRSTALPKVQGPWLGTILSPADGVGTIALTLEQSGTTVTGAVLLSQPGLPDARGTFAGTLDTTTAATLRYTVFYDYGDGCTGTYGGTLGVSGDTLSGPYVGQNCAHTFTGTLRVEKAQ